jgi:hypothetical protein
MQTALAQTGRCAVFFSSSGMGKAEKAYQFLGFSSGFRNCFGSDEVRQRRFAALLRAEMRRRTRLGGFIPDNIVDVGISPEPATQIQR